MFKRTIFIIIILFLVFSYNAYAKEMCKLLVQADNDLWIVDIDGRPIHRLTYDGVFKNTATFSPDGQYIAYSLATDYGDEKSIIIVDNAGQELSKVIVEPKTEDPHFQNIRWIGRLVWEKPNILWSESVVGGNASFIDIWELDSSLHYIHKKRIEVMGKDCEFSPNKQHVACIVRVFEIGMKESYIVLEINDTNKKEIPEFNFFKDRYFSDKNPRKVDIREMERVDKIIFTPDGTRVVIIGGDKKYEFNMHDNKLSEIKELPQGVRIKRLPETVKVKRDTELYQAEVFDMYCN